MIDKDPLAGLLDGEFFVMVVLKCLGELSLEVIVFSILVMDGVYKIYCCFGFDGLVPKTFLLLF